MGRMRTAPEGSDKTVAHGYKSGRTFGGGRMDNHGEQQKRAAGYFLIGLGAPVAAAFIYPLLARGRDGRGPLIDWETLSTSELTVFMTGAAVGLVMLAAGCAVLTRR